MGFLRRIVMGPAVQMKRILGGNFGQTRYTRYLEKHQYDSPEALKRMQADKLCKIMRHACDRIPYYKSLKGELKLTPETAFEDIKKFPIITKQMISERQVDFVDRNIPAVMRMKTGGTSNVKVEVIRDKSSHNMRNDEYFNRMIRVYPGMRRMILSRHESNYRIGNDEDPEKWVHYRHNRLSGTYHVKPNPLTEEKLSKIHDFYVSGKLEFLRANTNTGYLFAKYAEKMSFKLAPLKVLRCSSTQLVDEHRETFKRVFGTDPYDAYGASEINFVASQCDVRKGMHYIPMSHYIEILDSNNNEVAAGTAGSMVVTSLVHMAMPMIRYRIGDCAVLSDSLCSCGRTYPLIKRMLGRDLEVISTSTGVLTGADILRLIESAQGIADCQVIERSSGGILVNIAKSTDYKTGDENVIRGLIIEKIGAVDIEIAFYPILPILPNAKNIRVIPADFDSDIENKLVKYS